MNKIGFHSFTLYEKDVRHLKQYYDYTFHLYSKDVAYLHELLVQKKVAMHTSIGSTTHSVQTLYRNSTGLYPQKLRELALISLVSAFETYLCNSLREVFSRTKEPFMNEETLEIHKNELLSKNDIKQVWHLVITKECRCITSGGFIEAKKIYRKRFGIDLLTFPEISKLQEGIDTRHLFIHSSGLIDKVFQKKYSKGYIGSKIKLDNETILNYFKIFEDFGEFLNKKLMDLYPYRLRDRVQIDGTIKLEGSNIFIFHLSYRKNDECIMGIIDEKYNQINTIREYMIKAQYIENNLILFLNIPKNDYHVIKYLNHHPNYKCTEVTTI